MLRYVLRARLGTYLRAGDRRVEGFDGTQCGLLDGVPDGPDGSISSSLTKTQGNSAHHVCVLAGCVKGTLLH